MTTDRDTIKVKKRDEHFADTIKTKIWLEQASADNPYCAEHSFVHGYNLLDLSKGIDFSEAIYLNLKGELPGPREKALLNAVLVAISNLGPRHGATRAVMNAAVSKTDTHHLLPIGLTLLGGDYGGAGEVEAATRFIRKHSRRCPQEIARQCSESIDPDPDGMVAPGFGYHYGGIDVFAHQLAQQLLSMTTEENRNNSALQWGMTFSSALAMDNAGWRLPGVAAAALVDLGFQPKVAAGLFQLAAAPGLLAHGLEMFNKPLTAMPFVADHDYHYTRKPTTDEI